MKVAVCLTTFNRIDLYDPHAPPTIFMGFHFVGIEVGCMLYSSQLPVAALYTRMSNTRDQQVIIRYLHKLLADPDSVIAASSWSDDRAPAWKHSQELGKRARYTLTRILRPLGFGYGIRRARTISTQFFIAKVRSCR